MTKSELDSTNTYVYIDASNIRNALKYSGIELSFPRLFTYLRQKYSKLISIKYFEGIHKGDDTKKETFQSFEKDGIEIKSLDRKTYKNAAKYKQIKCDKCGERQSIQIMDSTNVFKSNIDVYLCTELFSDIFDKLKPIHLVIFSCDGDYAEMIKKALDLNSHLSVSVFATPYTRHNKYLSSRLQELVGYSARYHLVNIENIKDKIKK